MTDYKRRLGTAVATVAILVNGMTPLAFAGTTINITGNAADSDNDVVANVSHNTSVSQNNTANFTNNIDADADTGDNDANRNNGGNVSINTGDATTNVSVANSANQNWAEVDCCASGDTELKIAGNADDSNNTINYDADNKVKVDQDNDADFNNRIYTDADTGNNDANRNNGGDVEINTGDASVKVSVSNWANANSARVGGGEDEDGGDVSLKIVGNAADSDNDIVADLYSETKVYQDNYADFYNKVDADADTGDNDANRNNGGEVLIDTGNADVDVTVDNMANFNWADVTCGCLFGEGGLTVDVSNNGFDSNNTVNGDFDSKQKVDQDNDADFDNKVKALDAETGNNDANRNNAGAEAGDPTIETGDANVSVNVSNSANVNGLGGDEPEWPEWDFGGLHISLDFDLGDLLDALGL